MAKLFVASLSWHTTNEMLQEYFEQFGRVAEASVVMDRDSGRSRGFGFVTFEQDEDRDTCLKSGPHELDGRTIEPRVAEERGGGGGRSFGGNSGGGGGGGAGNWRNGGGGGGDGQVKKCFIGGLEANTTKDDIESYFAQFGTVSFVNVCTDRATGEPRGFGFVEFSDSSAASSACGDHDINGNGVNVKPAKEKQDFGGGGGGRGGRSFGGGNGQW